MHTQTHLRTDTHTHTHTGTQHTRTPWGNFDFVVMACQRALHIQFHAVHTHGGAHTQTHTIRFTLHITYTQRGTERAVALLIMCSERFGFA